jgi:hypothetical protein
MQNQNHYCLVWVQNLVYRSQEITDTVLRMSENTVQRRIFNILYIYIRKGRGMEIFKGIWYLFGKLKKKANNIVMWLNLANF